MCGGGIVQAGTIGYWVGEPHAHRGYMTAALRVLLPTLFGELNLHRVEAACIPHQRALGSGYWKNAASAARGWRGVISVSMASWQDHLLFGLLHEDFRG